MDNFSEDFLVKNHRDLLIVDLDKNRLVVEKGIFENHNLSVETSNNLAEAMKLLYIHSPKVLILDIVSQEIDIINMVRMVTKVHENSVIILRTNYEGKQIDFITKNGLVFSKIPKDTRIETLLTEINAAIKYYNESQKKLNYSDLSKDWLKEELEWLLWKEERTQNSQSTYGRKIIETIVHSIFQGLGVGGLLTLVDIMEMERKDEGDFARVKARTLDSVIKNSESIRVIKEKLDKVIHVFDVTYEKETIEGKDLKNIIKTCIKDIEPFSSIKKHSIFLDKITAEHDFYGNKKLIELSIKELLTNAFKYSPEECTIYLSVMHTPDDITIVITNPILPTPGGVSGIPKELEHKIFEPFFKINNIYDDRFFEEDLGFGVGLAVVQKGITSLGGKVHVYETTDHVTEKKPVRKIIAELGFPKIK